MEKKELSCVICYQKLSIVMGMTGGGSSKDSHPACKNQHFAHRECLKKWVMRSSTCPVCHEKYDSQLLESFASEIAQFKEEQAEKAQKAEEMQRLGIKEKIQKEDPKIIQLFEKAEKLAKTRKFEEATKLYWEILDTSKLPPGDSRMLKISLHMALAYYKLTKYSQCLNQLMKIIKIDYEYPLVFYFLGLTYEKLEIFDKSRWAYVRALDNVSALAKTDDHYTKYIHDIEIRLKSL